MAKAKKKAAKKKAPKKKAAKKKAGKKAALSVATLQGRLAQLQNNAILQLRILDTGGQQDPADKCTGGGACGCGGAAQNPPIDLVINGGPLSGYTVGVANGDPNIAVKSKNKKSATWNLRTVGWSFSDTNPMTLSPFKGGKGYDKTCVKIRRDAPDQLFACITHNKVSKQNYTLAMTKNDGTGITVLFDPYIDCEE